MSMWLESGRAALDGPGTVEDTESHHPGHNTAMGAIVRSCLTVLAGVVDTHEQMNEIAGCEPNEDCDRSELSDYPTTARPR